MEIGVCSGFVLQGVAGFAVLCAPCRARRAGLLLRTGRGLPLVPRIVGGFALIQTHASTRKLFCRELCAHPSIHLLLFHGTGWEGLEERMKTVAEGDVVIAWAGAGYIVPIKVQRGEVFGTRFGRIQHDDMIGRPLGSRVYSRELPNKKKIGRAHV